MAMPLKRDTEESMEQEAKTLMQSIASYAVSLKKDTLKPDIWDEAVRCFADVSACMIAGVHEPATEKIRRYVAERGSNGACQGIGLKGLLLHPEEAALLNGVSAHVLEFDDINNTSIGHPSVPVMPAALALGEAFHKTGKEVLEAYITGVEIYSLMGRAVSPEHNKNGWNSTESLGIFGATAAAAKLLQLNEEEFTNALGIAASESCGLKGNSGTMTKPLHAGRAAQKGIFAATLAGKGLTANPEILETKGGFAYTVAGGILHKNHLLEAIEQKNSEFLNIGITIKPWPVCRAAHNCIDAMQQIMRQPGFDRNKIEKIICILLPGVKETLRYEIVKNSTEGQFSIHYCIALLLQKGKIGLQDVDGRAVTDKELISYMQKISVSVNDKIYFDNYGEATVIVRYKDGSQDSKTVKFAKGDPNNPMSEEECICKIKDCLENSINPDYKQKIIDKLYHFPECEDAAVLLQTINEGL